MRVADPSYDPDGSGAIDLIRFYYHTEELTQTEIAELFGRSVGWVSIMMREHGIETRDPVDSRGDSYREIPSDHPMLEYIDWLTPTQERRIKLAVNSDYTLREIAESEGVASSTVSDSVTTGLERLRKIWTQNIENEEVTRG